MLATRRIFRGSESWVFAAIVALSLLIQLRSGQFYTANNLVDVVRALIVPTLFSIGCMMVIVSGGIDVSFTAIAALTMYSITLLTTRYAPGLPMVLVVAMAVGGGALLGMFNGLLVHNFGVPPMIVTIGTQYLFRGILLAFIGTVWIMALPEQMIAFGRAPLLQFANAKGTVITLPLYVLVLPVAAVLTWWILNRTLIGRAIFAMGGSARVAERLGYNLRTVHLFVFGFAGALAGLAGIIHVCSNRLANPFDLVGTEINVIAAVVLGGARITGGTGTVVGTLLGVLLVTVINNVLVMVGIPSTWQRFVVGTFILLAAAFFVVRQRRA